MVNIVRNQPRGEVKPELFIEPSETRLYEVYQKVRGNIEKRIEDGTGKSLKDYLEILEEMKTLKEPVDTYFDDVLVMTDENELRINRLSTLWAIRDLFFKVADFSKIST